MGMDFSDAFNPIRALRHGWAAFQHEPPTVLICGVLLFGLNACQGGGNYQLPQGGGGMDEALAALAATMAVMSCCIGLAAFIVRGFLEPGILRAGARLTQDGAGGMDVVFSGKDAWVSMLGYMLLQGGIVLGVVFATALPGGLLVGLSFALSDGGDPSQPLLVAGTSLIALVAVPALVYVQLGLQLGLQLGKLAVALDDCTAMQALDRSWRLARGNRLTLFVFNIVNAMVYFAGLLVCCVGAIPAQGLIVCATTNAYLMHTREDFEDFALSRELGAY